METNCSGLAGTLWLIDSGRAAAMDAKATWTLLLDPGRSEGDGVAAGRGTVGIGRGAGKGRTEPELTRGIAGSDDFEVGTGGTGVGFANGVAGTDSDFDNIFLNNPSMCCLSLFRWRGAACVEPSTTCR